MLIWKDYKMGRKWRTEIIDERNGRFQLRVGGWSQKNRLRCDEGERALTGVGTGWGGDDWRDTKSMRLKRGVEQWGRNRMWGSQERKVQSRQKLRRIREVSGTVFALRLWNAEVKGRLSTIIGVVVDCTAREWTKGGGGSQWLESRVGIKRPRQKNPPKKKLLKNPKKPTGKWVFWCVYLKVTLLCQEICSFSLS